MKLLAKTTLALLVTVAQLQAQEAALPRNMAALGDSITAAAFGRFTRADGTHIFTLLKLLDLFAKAGYSRSAKAFEAREVSWSTGAKLGGHSHLERLTQLNGTTIPSLNAAVSGARARDLSAQVDNLLEWSNNSINQSAPDYVTLLIGANDACGETPPEEFIQEVQKAIEKITQANPKAKIMMAGVPNIEHLREVAVNSPLSNLPGLKTCQDMWKRHGFCKEMLQEDDPAKRAAIMARLFQYDTDLEALKTQFNAQSADPDQIRFAGELTSYRFTDNDIAIDCFHPNLKGQQIISDLTWQKSWWAK